MDLLFGLAKQTGPTSPRGYAEKWRKRMIEAYRVANGNSQSSSSKGKSYYDQKMRGVVLKAGDRVLVRNMEERGGPGKFRSYWEDKIYVVKEQVSDNPVYVIHPEDKDQARTRTLHRNLLLLVNDLLAEFPQRPAKLTSETAQGQANARVRRTDQVRMVGADGTSDSEDDSGSGYWLRVLISSGNGAVVTPEILIGSQERRGYVTHRFCVREELLIFLGVMVNLDKG